MLTTVLSISFTVCLSDVSQAKTVWLEEDDFRTVAQGDGDYEPTNLSTVQEEVSLQTKKSAGQKKVTVRAGGDNLPTMTTEGSFLLPTYVLPEARPAQQVKVTSVDEKNPWRQMEKTTTTHTRRTFVKGSSVVPQERQMVVTSNNSNVKEAQLLANIEKQYQQTSVLLENTSRRLSALEAGVENLSQKTMAQASNQSCQNTCNEQGNANQVIANQTAGSQTIISRTASNQVSETEQVFTTGQMTAADSTMQPVMSDEIELVYEEEPEIARTEPLLLPLAPGHSVPVSIDDEMDKMGGGVEPPSGAVRVAYVDYILGVIKRNMGKQSQFSERDELILRAIPKEMKISFMPEVADLSDQAFKWIKVFAYNPLRSGGSAVEIRLSGNNLDLQSRRFALIKGVLLSSGVSPRQVRFVFTDRDPDTVVLRTIALENDVEYITQVDKNGKTSQQIIQKW